jgi:hypothetical protein
MAVGMYSGEGEYVPFATQCLCDGPVEVGLGGRQAGWLRRRAGLLVGRLGQWLRCRHHSFMPNTATLATRCLQPLQVWLQTVVDAMRAALSHEFRSVIPTYDEKPRTKWIFDSSVQNTVVVSRLFYTQEVRERWIGDWLSGWLNGTSGRWKNKAAIQ